MEITNELTKEFLKKVGLSNRKENFETFWYWPDRMGEGSVREINLRPGLKMLVVDCSPDVKPAMGMEIGDDAPLEFNFFLSGMTQSTIIQSRSKDEIFAVGTGQTCIGYYGKSCCAIQPIGKEPLRVISIYMLPRLLTTLIEEESDRISADFQSIVEGVGEKTYYQIGAMTASMHMVIHQILNCPYQGITRQICLEGLALELIAHRLSVDMQPKGLPTFRSSDREKIYHAREILTHDLENPPNLFELAKSVGLTHTKLNRGFREIYGTTAFCYLHQQRLEYGKMLLQEGMMSISEVAYTSGFSSPSHFGRAFLKYYGTQPGTYLKEISKKMITSLS